VLHGTQTTLRHARQNRLPALADNNTGAMRR
jgi:hypothetical protein